MGYKKALRLLNLFFLLATLSLYASHEVRPGERSVEERNRLEENIKERTESIKEMKEKIAREREREETLEQKEVALEDTRTLDRMIREQQEDIQALLRQDLPESYRQNWMEEQTRLEQERTQLEKKVEQLTQELVAKGVPVETEGEIEQVSISLREELEKQSWLPKKFFDKVQAWFTEKYAQLHEFVLNDKAKAIEIRKSLDAVYEVLDDPIKRAKNANKLAKISPFLHEKFRQHLRALDIYTKQMETIDASLRYAKTPEEVATVQEKKLQAEREALEKLVAETVTELAMIEAEVEESTLFSAAQKTDFKQKIQRAQEALGAGDIFESAYMSTAERAAQKARQSGAVDTFFKGDVQETLQAANKFAGTDEMQGLLDRKGQGSITEAFHSKEFEKLQETLLFLEKLNLTELSARERINVAKVADRLYTQLSEKYVAISQDPKRTASLSRYEKVELTRQHKRALQKKQEWQEILHEAAREVATPKPSSAYSPEVTRYVSEAKTDVARMQAASKNVTLKIEQFIKEIKNDHINAASIQEIPATLRTLVIEAIHADPSQDGLAAVDTVAALAQEMLQEISFYAERAKAAKKPISVAQVEELAELYANVIQQVQELTWQSDLYQDALTQVVNGTLTVLPQVSRVGAQRMKLSDRFVADPAQKEVLQVLRDKAREAASFQAKLPETPPREIINAIKNELTAPGGY